MIVDLNIFFVFIFFTEMSPSNSEVIIHKIVDILLHRWPVNGINWESVKIIWLLMAGGLDTQWFF